MPRRGASGRARRSAVDRGLEVLDLEDHQVYRVHRENKVLPVLLVLLLRLDHLLLLK